MATYVYIGPSIPRAQIRRSQVLNGTKEEIENFLGDLKESYPEIEYLLVTPDKLTSALNKVNTKGSILHKYYQDVAAKACVSRKGY